MPLDPGTRLGPYEVVSPLGAGGMGEVYRARDTKLDRDVALKILPESFASDPDRLMRFEREAKTLAALNHPNIAAIYGLEENALVMELVEGADLSERISLGPVPLDDALPIARQIAEALEAAHEAGVIHRDLKPANIKVKADGTVKVLDFGLAKAMGVEGDGSGSRPQNPSPNSPTMTSPAMTAMGMILGTAAYMSPEQAKGKPVDRRADIWAFGVVLWEMLTGRQMFAAETVSESLAAVLRADIDVEALPRGTPSRVRTLVERCLDRDPRTRLRDIGEARVVLEQPGVDDEEPATSDASRRPGWLTLAATGVVTALLVGTVVWNLAPAPTELPVIRSDLGLDGANNLALSPDGRRLAYTAAGQLWVRDLDQLEPRMVVDLGGGLVSGAAGMGLLFWSPDGQTIGYPYEGELWTVAADGGTPLSICRLPNNRIVGATWGPDSRIVFASWRGALYEVAASGAEDPEVLVDLVDGLVDYHDPRFLPNGALMYRLHFTSQDDLGVTVLQGTRQTTVPAGGNPTHYSAGHLVYGSRDSNVGVWAVPFDLDRLALTGEPFMILPNVTSFTASTEGTLVYEDASGDAPGDRLIALTWMDSAGETELLPGDPREYTDFALSPDGSRVAAVVSDRGEFGIVLIDVARGGTVPLVAPSPEEKIHLSWSADGQWLLYAEERGFTRTVRVVQTDGRGQPRDLVEGGLPGFSPDGSHVVFQVDEQGRRSLWTLSIEDGAPTGGPTLVREGAESLQYPTVSPDGTLVAYAQGSGPDFDVYVSRFPDGSGQWPVSVGGGLRPQWDLETGDLLFFRPQEGLMAVSVTSDPDVSVGDPRVRFPPLRQGGRGRNDALGDFDVSPDGRLLLASLANTPTEPVERRLVVVQNWVAAFRN